MPELVVRSWANPDPDDPFWSNVNPPDTAVALVDVPIKAVRKLLASVGVMATEDGFEPVCSDAVIVHLSNAVEFWFANS